MRHPQLSARTWRAFVPREKGAYGQLLVPVATVLLAGRATLASVLLSLGFFTGFVSHRALLMAAGVRGRRHMRAARPIAAAGAGLAAVLLVAGVVAAGPPVQAPMGLSLLMGALVAVVALRGLERTTGGEVLAEAALCSCAIPVGVACSLSFEASAAIAAVFAVGFAVATLLVRGVLARVKGAKALSYAAVSLATLVVLAAGLMAFASGVSLHWPFALAILPAVCLAVAIWSPRPKHLRTVGFVLLFASIAVALVLIVPAA